MSPLAGRNVVASDDGSDGAGAPSRASVGAQAMSSSGQSPRSISFSPAATRIAAAGGGAQPGLVGVHVYAHMRSRAPNGASGNSGSKVHWPPGDSGGGSHASPKRKRSKRR